MELIRQPKRFSGMSSDVAVVIESGVDCAIGIRCEDDPFDDESDNEARPEDAT
jgi:hypothetical protein